MLWNSIFEFFVTKIFGGRLGDVVYTATLGIWYDASANIRPENTTLVALPIFNNYGIEQRYVPLGNYLSMIATIITIVIILILCCLFIKKIISLMGKLFSGGTL